MDIFHGKGVYGAIAIGRAAAQLAADTTMTETLLRMGIDELSVSAPFVLPVRDAVRWSTVR